MKENLFDAIKRLLEYSGSKIKTISRTKDGVVADVDFIGRKFRFFVTPMPAEDEKNQLKFEI